MKRTSKIFGCLLCAALMALPVFLVACEKEPANTDPVDYVEQLTLDWANGTKKQEVTVKLFIDGDTTHFEPVADSALTPYHKGDFDASDGYIKARYLAINTPESTGVIEKWGKTASNFTKEKLSGAESIVVESDDANWNFDSTSSKRLLLWVWYKPKGAAEYRNLNVEILQNGFAVASSTKNNRYGDIAMAALEQAKAQKLHVFAPKNVKDENFYEGSAISVDLKELRCHAADYDQMMVAVEGVVVAVFGNSAYIESFDADTEMYFGFAVYYGFKTGTIVENLSTGNLVRVVGNVTAFQGTYQISGVSFNERNPNALTNTIVLEEGHSGAFTPVDAKDIVSGKIDLALSHENEDGDEVSETVTLDYGDAITSTSVSLTDLTVYRASTTVSQTDSNGSISLYCRDKNGTEITVRTEPMMENGVLITQDRYVGKTISVRGIVEKYSHSYDDGYEYQIKVHRADYITVAE